jgi:kynurenine 3-monooxygenase
MRHADHDKLLQHVFAATIPMRGRMIHGKRPDGELYEAAQDYDIHGRVRYNPGLHSKLPTNVFESSC